MDKVLHKGSLVFLDLSYNNLGDQGMTDLALALHRTHNLRKLCVVECKFGPVGAEQLF